MLKVLSDPEDPEHVEMRQWVGGAYDPEDFSPDEVVFDDPAERWQLKFGSRR